MKRITLVVLALLSAPLLHAQKESGRSFNVMFTIAPQGKKPESVTRYSMVLNTPIDPLSYEDEVQATKDLDAADYEGRKRAMEEAKANRLNKLRRTYLAVSAFMFAPAPDDTEGDWIISLTTNDVQVSNINEKPIHELSIEDKVFSYQYAAVLTLRDKAGNTVWEKTLSTADEQHYMTKDILYMNLAYKLKMQLYKNNPDKLKKFSDKVLTRKSHLVLYEIMEKADKALMDNYEVQKKRFVVGVFTVKGKAYSELGDVSDKVIDANNKFHAPNKKNRIAKEDMDQVMRDAAAVWTKYLDQKSAMDEKAHKGLLLNCALAYTWLGEFDKAGAYLDQVPEAKLSGSVDEVEDANDGPPTPTGAVMLISFDTYARHIRGLYEVMKEYKSAVTITQ